MKARRYFFASCWVIALGVIGINAKEEKPLVIGICSYNNALWYRKNLSSVFSQKYQNYRVIYVDDYSEDGTADLVEQFVKESGQEHRFTLLRNKKRHRALANHYQIIHACRDHEILVSFDGDDWWAHDHALARINEVYQDDNIVTAWSQFTRWPSGAPGYSHAVPLHIIEKNKFRKYPYWIWGQTRTYYAWLAKKIKLKDLLMQQARHPYYGKFFPSSCDAALIFPILEMAGSRIKFIKESLYIYNMHDFNDRRVNSALQGYCNWCIRQLPCYKPTKKLERQEETLQEVDGLFLLSDQAQWPMLKSMLEQVQGLRHIFIIADNLEHDSLIAEAEKIQWINQKEALQMLHKVIFDVSAPYLLLTTSPVEFSQQVDTKYWAGLLQQTRAYAVFLKPPFASQLVPSCDYFTSQEKDILFWLFGKKHLHPHSAPVMLIKKKKIAAIFASNPVNSLQDFLTLWQHTSYDSREVGLIAGDC